MLGIGVAVWLLCGSGDIRLRAGISLRNDNRDQQIDSWYQRMMAERSSCERFPLGC
jgi:hypothetical protein